MNLSAMIRPEVRDFEPYLPGKPIEEVRRELGLKKVVKLASNENALGTSSKARRAIAASAAESFRYPEGPGTLLKRDLAKKLGVSEGEIILGAGSDEIIEVLAKSFFNREDEIIVSRHAFIRYKMAADLMGAKTIEVPMKNFKHDLGSMAEKIGPRTKAIFVANPNNPTGTYVTKPEVAAFMKTYAERVGSSERPPFIVFDEAYYEFAKSLAGDYPEMLEYLKRGVNLVVLRTFSKAYGLAGLRVGYGVAKSEVIQVLDRVRPPFNVSSVAQAGARAALTDQTHVRKSVAEAAKGLKYLAVELKKLNIPFLPSAANFLLLDVSPRKGRDVFQALLKKGLVVRAMDEYGFPERVRVTVGTMPENKFLITRLKELLS
ncbi:MAG: histidinol-phosphate transaminase [Elusimicrobia bacterium RIFCSPLOWO2_01_FULL_54_10]|nr:MAG: histidinol-phosphate transaminase [Elusimicrobia bacterium RIFCSPLOWO2_01_FULL_54_10]